MVFTRAADLPPAEQARLVGDLVDTTHFDVETPAGVVPDVPDPDEADLPD